jgi:xanthine dehydrogenase accessory factor
MKRDLMQKLLAAQTEKRPTVLATDLESGAQTLVIDGSAEGDIDLTDALWENIERVLRRDKGEAFEVEGRRFYLQPYTPPKRMIVVGAVHIAQSLVPMASLAGFEVTVLDPRQAFANLDRFPGVTLSHDWPDEGMAALDPDRRTAVVTLTHDPKLDDPALAVALRSAAFYIGALGSRRTNSRRQERLRELGFGEADFARIHGPIGLNIGAVSPAEIAISILAEITEVMHAPARREAA